MVKAEPRAVTPILSVLRNLLLGRSHNTPLRFGDYYAPRTQPPPEIPGGPHNKLSDNYYCSHDGRRESAPPLLISSNNKIRLIQGKSESPQGQKTPGTVYQWD